jgi:hypothetical protein
MSQYRMERIVTVCFLIRLHILASRKITKLGLTNLMRNVTVKYVNPILFKPGIKWFVKESSTFVYDLKDHAIQCLRTMASHSLKNLIKKLVLTLVPPFWESGDNRVYQACESAILYVVTSRTSDFP